MKQYFVLLFTTICFVTNAQITGTITDTNGEALPFVNIVIENTYKGTTTNTNGIYELNISRPSTYSIVFSFLGYKTLKKTVTIKTFPYTLNVSLQATDVSLDEVTISAENNPAIAIIKNAIAKRKTHLKQTKNYKADFYSRGLIRVKNLPKTFLGQDVDLDIPLDSTRSGIIYLSETVSKIEFLQPNQLKETITASKISGDDNGFSFNNARDVNLNFYNNTIPFGNQIISPIANNAFSYYNYKMEGVFYDERGNLINKIKVIPKRKNDAVFSGFIYIVENQWRIYGIKLSVTGIQARNPAAEVISIQQSFSYSETDDIWAIISQSIDFSFKFFGFKGDGRFTATYNNYKFNTGIDAKSFGNQLVAFEANANKKDSLFWNKIRPVPLTVEEKTDYTQKDSIQVLKTSKPYLDSLDASKNTFKIADILGYTYQNSHKNYRLGFDINKTDVSFNTVQGYTASANAFYTKNIDEYNRYFNANVNVEYGFSDQRLRPTLRLYFKFNDIKKDYLSFNAGVTAQQFNPSNPISHLVNSVSSLFFEDNFMKLFENRFAALSFGKEVFNGLSANATLSYQNRIGVFNTTDQVFFNRANKIYTSNNPLDASNYNNAPFNNHHIIKANVSATINFDQKYLSYPNSKYNITSNTFPTVVLGFEKGFGATNSSYNFDQIKARVYQNFSIADKGRFTYNLRAGKFFNADGIAFMDYQHFNGNQTHVSRRGNYTDVFNNLDYYSSSTNTQYFEAHAEHDFNGYILGKIPGINTLNFNLIIGAHLLSTPQISPYKEFSVGLDNIGWGKWRFLRVDYIRSYQSGFMSDAVVFGLKFF